MHSIRARVVESLLGRSHPRRLCLWKARGLVRRLGEAGIVGSRHPVDARTLCSLFVLSIPIMSFFVSFIYSCQPSCQGWQGPLLHGTLVEPREVGRFLNVIDRRLQAAE